MMSGLEYVSYKASLGKLGLFCLECSRLRRSLIEICIIMQDIDIVDSQNLFRRMEMSRIREHSFKVRGAKFKGKDMRGQVFKKKR